MISLSNQAVQFYHLYCIIDWIFQVLHIENCYCVTRSCSSKAAHNFQAFFKQCSYCSSCHCHPCPRLHIMSCACWISIPPLYSLIVHIRLCQLLFQTHFLTVNILTISCNHFIFSFCNHIFSHFVGLIFFQCLLCYT